MNIAYFGSPDISALLLELLLEKNIHFSLVVTQPDKPVGKRLELTPTPVKRFAQMRQIEIIDKELTRETEVDLIKAFQEKNIDLGIVFAYGALLPEQLLHTPRHGFWNLHPSLLSKYRGPSPTAYPLIMEDSRTGISLMKMNKRMDTGDIIFQKDCMIKPDEHRGLLEERLTRLAVQPLYDHIGLLEKEKLPSLCPQQEGNATYTRLLTKNDGFVPAEVVKAALKGQTIDSSQLPLIRKEYTTKYGLEPQEKYVAATVIYSLYQGLMPWPGLWTKVNIQGQDKRIKLLDLQISRTFLEISFLQLEGKKRIDFHTFERAYNIFR